MKTRGLLAPPEQPEPAVEMAHAPATGDTDHLRTVAALVFLLELFEKKLAQMRSVQGLGRHAAPHAHIRSALSYERQILDGLTDPRGMYQLTRGAMAKLPELSPADALALLARMSCIGVTNSAAVEKGFDSGCIIGRHETNAASEALDRGRLDRHGEHDADRERGARQSG